MYLILKVVCARIDALLPSGKQRYVLLVEIRILFSQPQPCVVFKVFFGGKMYSTQLVFHGANMIYPAIPYAGPRPPGGPRWSAPTPPPSPNGPQSSKVQAQS